MRRILDAIDDLENGRRTPTDVAKTLLTTGFAVSVLLVLLFPVYWVVTASLSGGSSLLTSDGVFADPTGYNLEAYRTVLGGDRFWDTLQNSLVVVFVTVSVTVTVAVPGAYALSRRKFVGRSKVLYGYVLFTQIGSGLSVAVLVALYALFVQLGVDNNLLVLGLFYAAGAIPFNTWLLKLFMDNIPISYEEAAVVDGASQWQVVREVILPLAKPGLAVVVVFAFLAGWNEFIVAQTLLAPGNETLSIELYGLATGGRHSTPWTEFAAFAILFALPVATIYFFAQSYVESGLSFGGMEG